MLKVLVIDDDPTTCNLLETVLQMESFQAATASTIGDEGIISLLQLETPQILVLDFHLDGKEALEYISSIRCDSTWKDLPIVITSAIDRGQDCLQAGANGFILKPFNMQEIIESINQVWDSSIEKEG
jgi:DNA-binding response OmpR family regulator